MRTSMTTRRITPHKGGRTARAPDARIRPQTLAAIHATMREQGKSFADLVEEEYGIQKDNTMNQDIEVNSNWIGKSTGKIINVDSVDDQFVRFHTVQHKDKSAPEPNEWQQAAMPPAIFLQRYEHWID